MRSNWGTFYVGWTKLLSFKQEKICSFVTGFLWLTPTTFPSTFLMDFAKASKASFASLNWGSEVIDQGLLFGTLLRNLSTAARMALSEETLKKLPCFLPIHRQTFFRHSDSCHFSISWTGTVFSGRVPCHCFKSFFSMLYFKWKVSAFFGRKNVSVKQNCMSNA